MRPCSNASSDGCGPAAGSWPRSAATTTRAGPASGPAGRRSFATSPPLPPEGSWARAAAERILATGAERVVVKAQVLVGGRGKAGGVKLAGSATEAEGAAGQILGMDIKGITVRKVLVGEAADIVTEIYLGAVLDRD